MVQHRSQGVVGVGILRRHLDGLRDGDPQRAGGVLGLRAPRLGQFRGRAMHGRTPGLDHRSPVGLLVVAGPHHPHLAFKPKQAAGKGQRRTPLAGAGLGRELANAGGGVLVGLSHCGLQTGTATTSRFGVSPSSDQAYRSLSPTERDSAVAQAIADREGPRVSISTEINALSGSRRVRASFRFEDDAYVLVGHLDPDGVVRNTFPIDPRDDGFVRGQRTYQTAEFFAGFTDQYRYRYTNVARYRGYSPESYDGGASPGRSAIKLTQ